MILRCCDAQGCREEQSVGQRDREVYFADEPWITLVDIGTDPLAPHRHFCSQHCARRYLAPPLDDQWLRPAEID